MSLTGKTRFRVKTSWFGGHKLVLQVQYHTDWPPYPLSWRDATVEDLAELSNWKFNIINGG